ncbi:DUF6441 family protein [Sphingomonas sp.]|uniref:DUF6441 family protein n=1 Tax=Sphingomonas sp. TaxID=28214 RepID=UPI003B00C956
MKVSVGVSSFKDLALGLEGDIASAATEAMREASSSVKQELREQVTSAGLGNRLANTWRGETYPKSRRSVNPAGYIWSNAPDIVDSFVRGATIVPINGARFLAIPTDAVPNARGRRGARKKMNPAEVEAEFNQDLFYLRGRAGRVLAFLNITRSRNRRGFRQDTKGRRAQGRASERVLMFVLVRSVRVPKLLDLAGPADRGAALFEQAFTRRLAAL